MTDVESDVAIGFDRQRVWSTRGRELSQKWPKRDSLYHMAYFLLSLLISLNSDSYSAIFQRLCALTPLFGDDLMLMSRDIYGLFLIRSSELSESLHMIHQKMYRSCCIHEYLSVSI